MKVTVKRFGSLYWNVKVDEIFNHMKSESTFLEEELLAYASTDDRSRLHAKQQVDALIHLKSFPSLFRASYASLKDRLPFTIKVGVQAHDRVSTKLETNLPNHHYAHYRCAFRAEGKECETWTLIPYVADAYFRGLARILAVAGNIHIVNHDLETHLALGLRTMLCHRHDDGAKDDFSTATAAECRRVVEKWRADENLRRAGGKSMSVEVVRGPAAERQVQEILRLQEDNLLLRQKLSELEREYMR